MVALRGGTFLMSEVALYVVGSWLIFGWWEVDWWTEARNLCRRIISGAAAAHLDRYQVGRGTPLKGLRSFA